LVVKAWGPGLLHKSDVQAVRLGVRGSEVEQVAHEMAATLAAAGLAPGGFVVEEQEAAGIELIVGVVNRPDFGPVAALGLGGVMTELIDRSVARLCPIDEQTAWEMADGPRAPLRGGARAATVDRAALVSTILAVAGADGLAAWLGDDLQELECNPVIAGPGGLVAVDARLILRPPGPDQESLGAPAAVPFEHLFAPRSIGVMGASTSRETFGNRFLRAYRARGWRDRLVAVHPSADRIEGAPAVRAAADVPGGLDYLVVAVPAPSCPDVIRGCAGSVRFAQVMSGGFAEAGGDGVALEHDLLRAARQSGVRVVGPNCMGVYSPAGHQTWQLGDPLDAGAVSVVSQSGGLAGDVIKAGAALGIRFSKVASVGNAVDVTIAELVHYLARDPDTEVIGLYLEGARDGRALVEALRGVAGVKPVVALVGGTGRQGSRAVASHTGSMTGDARVWEAVGAGTGVAVVSTLEELLGALSYLQAHRAVEVADHPGVLVIGPGGGASILSADACDRAGLEATPVAPAVEAQLRALGYGAGTSLANPIEVGIGPAAPVDTFCRLLEPIQAAQPYADVVVHVNVQSFYSFGADGAGPLLAILDRLGARRWPGRLAVLLRNLDCAPAGDAAAVRARAVALGLPFFRTFDDAMAAVGAAKRFTHHRSRSSSGPAARRTGS
jgi:acyl-CoA synthetase (NDP forming)